MGNSWSPSPSFTSELTDDDEPPDKPPDAECDQVLKVRLLEAKNFNLSVGKMHTLVRVSTSFTAQSYTKPVKNCIKDGQTEWLLPTKRFIFNSADPTGNVMVRLLQNTVPPLPSIPNFKTEAASLSQDIKNTKTATLAKLTIPVTLEEFKVHKHVERWYTVDIPTEGEAPQVRVALDYVYKPPRAAGLVKTGQNISDKYDVDVVLGSGQSVVKKAVNKLTKKEVAVKFLAKSSKGQKIPKQTIAQEIDVLRTLSHPNIVELVETMENPETMYIVMELVKGADLFEITETLGCLPPGVAGSSLHQILSAVAYIHSRGYVHHDLKPENVVMDFQENRVKLTDFGSARDVKQMSGISGTINYMAPEVLMNMRGAEKPLDQSVDIWSIGVMAYVMLCGYNPFDYKSKANQNIITRIVSGKFNFPSPQWDSVPKSCKDFIRRCLVVDPKKRPSASELLKHPWMVASANPSAPGNCLSPVDRKRLAGQRSRNASRSNSLRDLMELFGSGSPIVLRS
jgi:tRNA A-37 threonylcarbamoyl transferase component Bud32